MILGITGGIGSGKSTVSRILSVMGIPVYIADDESKNLTANSPVIRAKLTEAFGNNLYESGKLNKSLLASYIFNDKSKLAIANAIIHPEVDAHFREWVELRHHEPIVAIEAAILYESGMDRFADRIIVVYSSLEERLKRVMERDGTTQEKVMERINSQMPDEEKLKLADFVVYNDENHSLIEQCLDIIENKI
jgi:dephospho-CoA kinase